MKILPNEEYTIRDLIRGDAFPWMIGMIERKQYREIGRLIQADSLGKNVLRVDVPTKSVGYKIKGRNITNFIKIYGPGLSLMVRNKSR